MLSSSTQSLLNGVDIYDEDTLISLPYTGVGVTSTNIRLKNKNYDSGNFELRGTLHSPDTIPPLDSKAINFQFIPDQNPEPVINFDYGTTMILYCGSTETVSLKIEKPSWATRYE